MKPLCIYECKTPPCALKALFFITYNRLRSQQSSSIEWRYGDTHSTDVHAVFKAEDMNLCMQQARLPETRWTHCMRGSELIFGHCAIHTALWPLHMGHDPQCEQLGLGGCEHLGGVWSSFVVSLTFNTV